MGFLIFKTPSVVPGDRPGDRAQIRLTCLLLWPHTHTHAHATSHPLSVGVHKHPPSPARRAHWARSGHTHAHSFPGPPLASPVTPKAGLPLRCWDTGKAFLGPCSRTDLGASHFTFEKTFPNPFFNVVFYGVDRASWHRNRACLGLSSADSWHPQLYTHGSNSLCAIVIRMCGQVDFSGAPTGITRPAWLV